MKLKKLERSFFKMPFFQFYSEGGLKRNESDLTLLMMKQQEKRLKVCRKEELTLSYARMGKDALKRLMNLIPFVSPALIQLVLPGWLKTSNYPTTISALLKLQK